MPSIFSYISSAFNDAYRAFDPLPDGLPEKNVQSIPPNLGNGNAPLDDLWYFMARETVRALARSIFGVELDVVTPLGVGAGHSHNQDQDAALAWMAPGGCLLWFDEGGVTEVGAAVLDQLAETDIAWFPFDVPDGTGRAYLKLRVGTQAADDIAFVRCRLYNTSSMNAALAVAETAFVKLQSPDLGASPLPDQWIELSPLDVTTLTASDNIRQGWLRVSGFVAVAGDKAWVSEILYALREGL